MSRSRDLQYALGGAASGLASTVPSALLLYFSTSVLGLAPAIVALILLLPKLLAIIGDPLCGQLFDRLGQRPTARAMLLAAGGTVMIAGLALVFAPPVLATLEATAWWLAIAYLVFCGGYSAFSVAHIAGPAVLSRSAVHRARLVGWRMTSVLIGILIGAAGAPLIVSASGGGRFGYAVMAFVSGCVIALLMIGPARVYERRRFASSPRSDVTAPLWAAFGVPDFRRLAMGYALMMAAVSALTAATPYWVIQRGGEGDVGVLLGLLLLTSIATAPLWSLICRWRGERFGYRLMLSGYLGLPVLLGYVLATGGAWLGLTISYVGLGAAFGGLQVVSFTMLAGLSSAATVAAGQPMDGVITGGWTAMEKLGLAVGPALAAGLLALTGGQADLTFSFGIAGLLALAAGIGWVIELGPVSRHSRRIMA
ncbi:MFS transporter [Sphingomonas sp. 28-63-12]|uniref:MFS transporter n=1 Tax=Sphingomonas sp. 28-63-12 TaxID=1970434 RepID=UPI0035A987CB